MYYYCTQLTLCLKQLSLLSHRNETLTQVPSPSCSWRMKSTDVGLDIAADPELKQKKVWAFNTKYPSSDFLYASNKKEERAQKVVAGMSLCVGRTTTHTQLLQQAVDHRIKMELCRLYIWRCFKKSLFFSIPLIPVPSSSRRSDESII